MNYWCHNISVHTYSLSGFAVFHIINFSLFNIVNIGILYQPHCLVRLQNTPFSIKYALANVYTRKGCCWMQINGFVQSYTFMHGMYSLSLAPFRSKSISVPIVAYRAFYSQMMCCTTKAFSYGNLFKKALFCSFKMKFDKL